MFPSKLNIRAAFAGALLSVFALLTGCASFAPSVPEGYSGPTAKIKDSAIVHSGSKVDYFYVRTVDGREIKNSRIESLMRNQGRGFAMDPVLLDHDVPAAHLRLEIVGRTEYAAPILALTNAVYEVKGPVEFTPVAGKVYVVKGGLSDSYSAVWVEDEATSEVVGNKVEVNGSAKLGFFQK